ncbi:hypothetical protein A1O1_05070 [Capronia coronata CBS 617.96]|uniref:RTA1 domain protein n=1 Tax=Capronia coronata CBS 617.96 TaxID=1182541 RepID=W9Y5N5_9EURO|nr:uncharacterized protein A1O1_05070 [Capronia coronata CBS 617.96]EXJ88142.1 hypothetical protein A1O1_05070 [Capronia coronata CBS 617.96]
MARLEPLDGYDNVYLWKYLPSVPPGITFLVLFTAATIPYSWRMVRTRSWFCIPFAFGGICQIIGYATRIYSHYFTNQLAPYAIQSSFILLAPVFYAATIYMMLGRLIRSVHGERFSVVRPKWMTVVFVTGDFLSLNIQGDGAGLTVKQKTKQMGEDIVIAGLLLQVFVFGFFVVAAVVFHLRMRRHTTKDSTLTSPVPWGQVLMVLYACSGLIMVRSIYRIVEYVMGMDAYLLSNEWPTYVFDAAPMWVVQVISFVWFPDMLQLKRPDSPEDGHALVENQSPTKERPGPTARDLGRCRDSFFSTRQNGGGAVDMDFENLSAQGVADQINIRCKSSS